MDKAQFFLQMNRAAAAHLVQCVNDSSYRCCELISRPGFLLNHSNRKCLFVSKEHFISLLSKTIVMFFFVSQNSHGIYREPRKRAHHPNSETSMLLHNPPTPPHSILTLTPPPNFTFCINTDIVIPRLIDPLLLPITHPGHLQTLSYKPTKIPQSSSPGHS